MVGSPSTTSTSRPLGKEEPCPIITIICIVQFSLGAKKSLSAHSTSSHSKRVNYNSPVAEGIVCWDKLKLTISRSSRLRGGTRQLRAPRLPYSKIAKNQPSDEEKYLLFIGHGFLAREFISQLLTHRSVVEQGKKDKNSCITQSTKK